MCFPISCLRSPELIASHARPMREFSARSWKQISRLLAYFTACAAPHFSNVYLAMALRSACAGFETLNVGKALFLPCG